MNKKYLQIIENNEEKIMIEKIAEMIDKMDISATPIQIENFILNDIEFPTPYGKFIQSQLELSYRFGQLLDAYYDIREKQLEIKKADRDTNIATNEIDKELAELKKEKLEIQLVGIEKNVKKILKEVKVFYQVYNKNPEFHNLTSEEAFDLEVENWAKKTLNMPTIFEERYGENYMLKVLGEENYRKYKELRQKGFGFLPREIFEVKQLNK